MKKKPVTHTLYSGNHARGPFARCTCGALLEGEIEIDEHRETKGALRLGEKKHATRT